MSLQKKPAKTLKLQRNYTIGFFFILVNKRLIHRGKVILFIQSLKIVHVEVSSREQLRETELFTTWRLSALKVITHT